MYMCMSYIVNVHTSSSPTLCMHLLPSLPQLSRCVADKQAMTHSLGVEKMAHIKTVEEIKELRGQLGRSRAQNEVRELAGRDRKGGRGL